MREIKFRVWSNQLNKMVYPDEKGWFHSCFIGRDQSTQHCQLGSAVDMNGKELSVMQFTGLKDKNSKEVYEGDICQDGDTLYEVRWVDNQAKVGVKVIKSIHVLSRGHTFPIWQCVIDATMQCKFEIIGNIHESKEASA